MINSANENPNDVKTDPQAMRAANPGTNLFPLKAMRRKPSKGEIGISVMIKL
jgi:hypothetical protein